jgi:hypothetical protein
MQINFGGKRSSAQQSSLSFFRDDFHVSFSPFLQHIPGDLQMTKAALEGNRCFFIHLGLAVGIHPFLLQTVFRHSSLNILQKQPNEWFEDLLTTIVTYCDFVDANALSFLWPREFDGFYICFLSGNTSSSPLITTFQSNKPNKQSQPMREVIIHCDGSHFTLLRPRFTSRSNNNQSSPNSPNGFQIIDQLVAMGKKNGLIVQENIAQEMEKISEQEKSIEDILKKIAVM